VLEVHEGEFSYQDALGETLRGNQRLEARGRVLAGAWSSTV
jgi:hypothetical protein